MPLHERSPVPLAGGNRVPDRVSADRQDDREFSPTTSDFQVARLIARHGLTPRRARLVARLAFGETEAA